MKSNSMSPMERWVREQASEHPNSVFARLKTEAIAAFSSRMSYEVPADTTSQQKYDWALEFEKTHPNNFTPPRDDLTGLSPSGLLGYANGEPLAQQPKKRK